jgi:hypothetical protein
MIREDNAHAHILSDFFLKMLIIFSSFFRLILRLFLSYFKVYCKLIHSLLKEYSNPFQAAYSKVNLSLISPTHNRTERPALQGDPAETAVG